MRERLLCALLFSILSYSAFGNVWYYYSGSNCDGAPASVDFFGASTCESGAAEREIVCTEDGSWTVHQNCSVENGAVDASGTSGECAQSQSTGSWKVDCSGYEQNATCIIVDDTLVPCFCDPTFQPITAEENSNFTTCVEWECEEDGFCGFGIFNMPLADLIALENYVENITDDLVSYMELDDSQLTWWLSDNKDGTTTISISIGYSDDGTDPAEAWTWLAAIFEDDPENDLIVTYQLVSLEAISELPGSSPPNPLLALCVLLIIIPFVVAFWDWWVHVKRPRDTRPKSMEASMG